MYTETRATVVELDKDEATLELEDGTRQVVHLPEALDVDKGTTVRIVDVGDGKPIYLWGR
jgi:hypothetical protein